MMRCVMVLTLCLNTILTACKTPRSPTELKFEDNSSLQQQLDRAPIGQLQDINRSKINKTPCTVFAFENGVATGGHCLLSPDRIADIVLKIGEEKTNVKSIVVRAFDELQDYAYLQTSSKFADSFRPALGGALPEKLYVVGYPFEPERAGIVPTNDVEKHQGFLQGSAKRVTASCSDFQNIDDSTISAKCTKEPGRWAGFSGAPLFDPGTRTVYGILVGSDANYIYFSKIEQLTAAINSAN